MISGVPGGSAHIHAPCPPLLRFRRECSHSRTLPAGCCAFSGGAHIHAPCPPVAALSVGGVLTFTHLARRLLRFRRECSHSRTLPAGCCAFGGSVHDHALCAPFAVLSAGVLTFTRLARRCCAFGGSAHDHAPCPPFAVLSAGVFTITHLARRLLRFQWGGCSHSRTLKAHH